MSDGIAGVDMYNDDNNSRLVVPYLDYSEMARPRSIALTTNYCPLPTGLRKADEEESKPTRDPGSIDLPLGALACCDAV